MNSQKIIMENWRRFLKENKEPNLDEAFASLEESNEEIEEGVASGMLAALMALTSPAELQIDGQRIVLDKEEIQQVDNMLKKMNRKDEFAGVPMDDINQSVKDLNRDAEDGQIDDELSSNPKRVGDRGEAILAQLILRVNDKSNDAEPEMEKPTIQQQIANLEKEIETDPTPMKIQRLQRLKSQAGGGAFGNMEETSEKT